MTRRYDKREQSQIRFKKHTNKHHVYPTSRFKLKKDPVLHTAWHDIFGNMTPEEAMEEVRKWQAAPKEFRKKILDNEKKLVAWRMLFGEVEFNDVLKIIQKDWTYPEVKMIKLD